MLANIFADFRDSPANLLISHMPKISLLCMASEAKDRLRRLEDLCIDDALLVGPSDDPAQLEKIAVLMG